MIEIALTKCIAAVEASREEYRGESELLREIYWQNVRTLVQDALQIAARSGGNISVPQSSGNSSFLLSVARSSAITGVREENEELLYLGLSALAMENVAQDYRETLIELTLIANSAKKIGIDIKEQFKGVASYCSEEFQELCKGFFLNGWMSLDAIGYCETIDGNGLFTYKQTW